MKKILAALTFFAIATTAHAQNVQQKGSVTIGHIPYWAANGVIGDGGTAADSPITTLGVTNNGAIGFCVSSGRQTATKRNQICLGAITDGGTRISSYTYGTATNPGISFDINGSVQGFPAVTLPVVDNHSACFDGTTGQLKDCGYAPLPAALPSAQIFVGNASNVAQARALSGNCTLSNTGVITCASAGLTVGTSVITGGTTMGVLFNNGGVLGNTAALANAVLVTNGSSVPAFATTLPSALTIPSPTISGTIAGTPTASGNWTFNGGTTIFGGSADPNIRLSPSSGATRTTTIHQNGDAFLIGTSGVANRVQIDLNTGDLTVNDGNIILPNTGGGLQIGTDGTTPDGLGRFLTYFYNNAGIANPGIELWNDRNPGQNGDAFYLHFMQRNSASSILRAGSFSIGFANVTAGSEDGSIDFGFYSSGIGAGFAIGGIGSNTVAIAPANHNQRYILGFDGQGFQSLFMSNQYNTADTTQIVMKNAAVGATVGGLWRWRLSGAGGSLQYNTAVDESFSTAGNIITFNTSGISAALIGSTIDNTSTVTLKDTLFTLQDDGDTTKQFRFNAAAISTATTRTLAVQNLDGTIALTANTLGDFASTTSAQLAGVISNETGSGSLVFATSPTLVTPTLGVATATSINFGGSTLDTYAVGAWSPTLVGSATPGTGQTYTTQAGSYERIGRQVTLRFNVTASSLGTAAGNMQIGNLPFAAANVTNDHGACIVSVYTVTGLAALNYGVTGFIAANTSLINLYQSGNTASSLLTVAQAGATAQFLGTCNYRAA